MQKRLACALAALALLTAPPASALVKQSASGLCHDPGSPWYDRTETYTAHPSMQACLETGRPYRGYDGPVPRRDAPLPYHRSLYGAWDDADGDCRTTRHERLAERATGPVTWDREGCRVRRGRWIDPYTGAILRDASRIDIDHVVPLAWAHRRGAAAWPPETRKAFANDPANLRAVDAGANRAKGARGPLDWLPPNPGARCAYILRFQRLVRRYDLQYRPGEAPALAALRARYCD